MHASRQNNTRYSNSSSTSFINSGPTSLRLRSWNDVLLFLYYTSSIELVHLLYTIQYTVYCIQYTDYCILNSVYCIMYTLYSV